MWNQLEDIEENEKSKTKKGFLHNIKKYKKLILIFLAIFIIYILFIVYYEISEKKFDKDIDCNILNEECKNYNYPEFDYDKLLLIDVNLENNNFLLRSNVPIFNGKFSEEFLLKKIKKKIEDSNLVFHDNYSLYIISLLSNKPKEVCCYASERCYVKNAFIDNQIILGSNDQNPFDLDESVLNKKLKTLIWNTDDILNKVKNLHDKFTTMKNTIFVIHCRGGKDRTGEYVGAYRMLIKKNSFVSIMSANSELGNLKDRFIIMQKWLCLYLTKFLKYPDLECFNYKVQ